MQHTDTRINRSGDGMTTVEFLGEGGELVSVKMASDNLERDAAVNRARAVMVQLTTFAEDRETQHDEWKRPDDAFDGRAKGPAEADAERPTILPFGNAPASVA